MARKRRDVLAHRDLFSVAAIGLLVLQSLWFHRFRLDDAFISYRYARHLAAGLGPVMNAGERVEGVSNLPWTAMLGLLGALGLEAHAVAPVLALLCGLVVVGLTAALAARALGDRTSGGPAALFAAASAPLAIWAVSGMETLAFTALLATLYYRSLHEHAKPGSGFVTGIVLGGVVTLRPEGIAYALPLALVCRARKRWLAAVAMGTLTLAGPVVLFRLLYYHAWLPNPVVAKVTPGAAALASGLLYVGKGIVTFPLLFAAALVLRGLPAAPLLGGWIATTLLVALVAGGERVPGQRLLVPAWPALAVAAELALRRIGRILAERPAGTRIGAIVLALGGMVCVLVPGVLAPLETLALRWARVHQDASSHAGRLAAEARFLGTLALALAGLTLALAARRHTWAALRAMAAVAPGDHAVRGFESERRQREAQRGLGLAVFGTLAVTLLPGLLDPALRACRQADPAVRFGQPVGEYLRRTLAPGTWVATNCAGSLPYFSELPVIDMLGLTDAHIARVRPDRDQWIGHEKGDGAYVLSRRPEIIVLGGPQGSETPWPFPGDQQIAAAPEFARDYVLQRVPLSDFEFVYYSRRESARSSK